MELESVLKALGDPTRFRIYRMLLSRKHCVRSLSRAMNITESAVSQHLRILREAGLVYREKFGYHTHYLPVQKTLDGLCEAFAEMSSESLRLDRATDKCTCEYRSEKEEP